MVKFFLPFAFKEILTDTRSSCKSRFPVMMSIGLLKKKNVIFLHFYSFYFSKWLFWEITLNYPFLAVPWTSFNSMDWSIPCYITSEVMYQSCAEQKVKRGVGDIQVLRQTDINELKNVFLVQLDKWISTVY